MNPNFAFVIYRALFNSHVRILRVLIALQAFHYCSVSLKLYSLCKKTIHMPDGTGILCLQCFSSLSQGIQRFQYELQRNNQNSFLSLLSLAAFSEQFKFASTLIAITTIQSSFNTSFSYAQWLLVSCLLTVSLTHQGSGPKVVANQQPRLMSNISEPHHNRTCTLTRPLSRGSSVRSPLTTRYGLFYGLLKSTVALFCQFGLPQVLTGCLAPKLKS